MNGLVRNLKPELTSPHEHIYISMWNRSHWEVTGNGQKDLDTKVVRKIHPESVGREEKQQFGTGAPGRGLRRREITRVENPGSEQFNTHTGHLSPGSDTASPLGWSGGWWDRRAGGSLGATRVECVHLGSETVGTTSPCWWECKWVQPLWKTIWRFLKKLKIELWCSNSTPGYISKENKNTPTPRFTAALFAIANMWKQHSIQQQKMCIYMNISYKKMKFWHFWHFQQYGQA